MENFGKVSEKLQSMMSQNPGVFSADKLLSAVIVAVVCFFAIKIILKLVGRLVEKTPFDNTLNSFIKSAVKIILCFVAVLLVADSMGIPVTSLLALFSVVGLALSLAVQGFLSNLAGGISILAAKPFTNGDFVEIGGVGGTVKEIGLIYTKLNTIDNKLIHVPNSEVSGEKIINYTAEGERMLDIKITAAYDAKPEEVKASLKKAAEKTGYVIEGKPVFAGVWQYGSSSIEYAVRAWVRTEDYWGAYFALMENIGYAFSEDGIEMTYDHLNVHMVNK